MDKVVQICFIDILYYKASMVFYTSKKDQTFKDTRKFSNPWHRPIILPLHVGHV